MVKEFKATGTAFKDFKSFDAVKKGLNQRVGLQTPLIFGHKYDNQILQAKKIFEIGCGLGRNLEWIMKNTKANYYGVEPNDTVLTHFWEYESNLEYKERVYLSNSFNEEIKKHKFDIIVCMFVFQHIGYRTTNIKNAMDIDEITHEILPMTTKDTLWFLVEHEHEEANWQAKWIMNSGFILLQEFKDKDIETYKPKGGHNILILKNDNIF